jgi:hypothetical protein
MIVSFDDLIEAIGLADNLEQDKKVFILLNLNKVFEAYKKKFNVNSLDIEI